LHVTVRNKTDKYYVCLGRTDDGSFIIFNACIGQDIYHITFHPQAYHKGNTCSVKRMWMIRAYVHNVCVCMYVCMYVCIFLFIYSLLFAPLLYNSNNTSLIPNILITLLVYYVHVCVYVCMNVCACMCVSMYVLMYVCMYYACMYTYICRYVRMREWCYGTMHS
jgi:hypothetical protein